jgi:hypothetical protein
MFVDMFGNPITADALGSGPVLLAEDRIGEQVIRTVYNGIVAPECGTDSCATGLAQGQYGMFKTVAQYRTREDALFGHTLTCLRLITWTRPKEAA